MNRPFVLSALFLCAFFPGACLAQAAPPFTPNYVHAPTLDRLLHWNQFPVRVFLATHDAAEAQDARSVLAGFDSWVKATGGIVNYTVVNSPAEAEITVRFAPESSLPGKSGLVGTTSVLWRGTTLKKANMELATGDLSPDELQSTAAHEFGHALGIEGHSDNEDDLMYPCQIRVFLNDALVPAPPRPVTKRDLNTLKSGYLTLFGPA